MADSGSLTTVTPRLRRSAGTTERSNIIDHDKGESSTGIQAAQISLAIGDDNEDQATCILKLLEVYILKEANILRYTREEIEYLQGLLDAKQSKINTREDRIKQLEIYTQEATESTK